MRRVVCLHEVAQQGQQRALRAVVQRAVRREGRVGAEARATADGAMSGVLSGYGVAAMSVGADTCCPPPSPLCSAACLLSVCCASARAVVSRTE